MRGARIFGAWLALGAICSAAALAVHVLPGAMPNPRDAEAATAKATPGEEQPTPEPRVAPAMASADTVSPPPAAPPATAPRPADGAIEPEPVDDGPPAAPVAPVATVSSVVAVEAGSTIADAQALALLGLMNEARVREGLAPLARDSSLDAVALARAEDLVAQGYFDHYSPQGASAFSELAERGIAYRLAGENLARNNYPEATTVAVAFDGLMASPGHRANILEPVYESAGVAAVRRGAFWLYVTVFVG
jgi:uncharacterized protein YkwD